MILKLLSILMLVGVLAKIVTAAPLQVVNNRYVPGYVDYPTEIALFVPAGLTPACSALKRGEFLIARKVFANEIRLHPDDLAASLGFLQSARDQWDDLLPQYQNEVKKHDSVASEFRLGVLAWYIQGEPSVGFSVTSGGKRQRLSLIARRSLQRSYESTYAPIVGFTLAYAYGDIGGGDDKLIYEDMLRRVGGEEGYTYYLNAKKNGWSSPQPPIPDFSQQRLLITQEIVSEIWADYGTLLNDHPVHPDQQQAMKFLEEWRIRLRKAAAQEKAATVPTTFAKRIIRRIQQ